ncbi:MAG: sugar phosphate nucleotidyltransferase [Pseudomonadota bacterium]
MKVILLAAGYGKRMGKLSEHTPKPLTQINGTETLIEANIRRLAAAGFNDIIINVSYLAEKIVDKLGDGQAYGVQITYSHEPQPLGWSGGIRRILPTLDQAPFAVISSDLWTDYPFSHLRQKLTRKARLVLINNQHYHGDFALDKNSFVYQQSRYTYGGIGVFDPILWRQTTEKTFSFMDVILPAIDNHLVTGECYHGAWFNIGTPDCLRMLRHWLTENKQ